MIALATFGTVAAGATVAPSTAVYRAAPAATAVHPDGVVCYVQSADDTGTGTVSQTFTNGQSVYDSYGADDFTLPENCRLSAVIAVGSYFNGSGPAQSETVTIYKNADGAPGKQIYTTTATGLDNAGTFTTRTKNGVKLRAGVHYWLSVSANMSFVSGGEWFWETTSDRNGSAALWENPNGGFTGDCTTWTNLQTCFGGSGVDYMFTLKGRVSG